VFVLLFGLVLIYLPSRLFSAVARPAGIGIFQVAGILIGATGAAIALWCASSSRSSVAVLLHRSPLLERVLNLRQLMVGATTLKDRAAAIVERSAPDAPDYDGLLPLHMFASVSFNSLGRYLAVRHH
jgi:hypothetical protein